MSFPKGATPKGGQPTLPTVIPNSTTPIASATTTQSILQELPNFRTFKVAHQRVSLDINFKEKKIIGSTSIILIPLIQDLKYITLDCKNLKILKVFVENRKNDNYIYDDPIRSTMTSFFNRQQSINNSNDILYSQNSVEQSHFLRDKFASLKEFPDESTKSQLTIKIPSFVKISLQDANTLTSYTPITPSIRSTPALQDTVYSPISIKIEYELSNPITGLNFDTISEFPHLWNCYTTNSELCETASHWMPCVNLLDEKSTWELEFSIPRKVKDMVGVEIDSNINSDSNNLENNNSDVSKDTKKISSEQLNTEDEDKENNIIESKGTDNNDDDKPKDIDEEDEDVDMSDDDENEDEDVNTNNPLNRDMHVVCSEYSTMKELPHPTDPSKKLLNFQIFNPIAPHHVGWSIASFNIWTLPSLITKSKQDMIDEEFQDELLDESNNSQENYGKKDNDKNPNTTDLLDELEVTEVIPVQIYTLPTQDIDEKTVLNSTIVCQKIMDFFAKEFGSYPFTSYCLVFLPTVIDNTMDFASMTICNTRLLYPPSIIDTMYDTTNILAWSIALQWSGVNITPSNYSNIWCCLGMAGYMVFQFWKRLMGTNDFKYRLKLASEKIVEQDWEKPPIGSTFNSSSRPISTTSKDYDFIKLKAPMVLYILDRRMTKTERSFGMSRVLPKIFLQAMSGDLPNNSLTASHFIHVCEKVNKNKLDKFFQQWVYGSGVPIFRVTQKFNRKRMVVEIGIRQVQNQELGQGKVVGEEGFCSSALQHFEHPDKNATPFFTGSMTIRIHESDGSPYEHIVELNETFTKLDIQYNTKYKKMRLKKVGSSKTMNKDTLDKTDSVSQLNELNNEKDGSNANVQRLGNVLTSPSECYQWGLTDFNKITETQEYQIQSEVFEWIRIDSDFEWICKININQPDYMFASQLRQDGDVEAQLESIRYYEDVIIHSAKNSLIYSSMLTRTIMDPNYFYGIRIEACRALAKFLYKTDDPENIKCGSIHLILIFRSLFCYEQSNITKNNDFTDFRKYFLQKAIPEILSTVRDDDGTCPSFVKQFLLDLLTYNENSGNLYDDIHYTCSLLTSLVDCALSNLEDKTFIQNILDQFKRLSNLEGWIPSYRNLITKTILEGKAKLNLKDAYEWNDFEEILQYLQVSKIPITEENTSMTREGMQDIILLAFRTLLFQGGLKNREALKYFFEVLCFSPDIYVKQKLVDVFIAAIDFYNDNNNPNGTIDDDIEYTVNKINPQTVSIEDENDVIYLDEFEKEINARKDGQKRSHLSGMLSILRKPFKEYGPLKQLLWDSLHMPLLSLYQKKRLFDITRILYSLNYSLHVALPLPRQRKLIAKALPENKVAIKKESLMKVHIPGRLKISLKSTVKFSNSTSSAPILPSVVPPPVNTKIKLTLNKKGPGKAKKPAVTKPKSSKGSVNRVGFLPIRFVKIGPGTNKMGKKVDISSTPFSKNVQILKANKRSFTVKIQLPKKTLAVDQAINNVVPNTITAEAQSEKKSVAMEEPVSDVVMEKPVSEVTTQESVPDIAVQEPASNIAIQEPIPEAAMEAPAPEVAIEEPVPEVATQENGVTVEVSNESQDIETSENSAPVSQDISTQETQATEMKEDRVNALQYGESVIQVPKENEDKTQLNGTTLSETQQDTKDGA